MKVTYKRLFLFLLPVVITGICFEIFLRMIPNDYRFKKEYLDRKSKEIEVVTLGGSHAFYGLNPTYINYNCFNASYVSQSLNYDLEILKKYDGKWDKLRFVLIPVSFTTLYSRLEKGDEAWRAKNYTIYYGINLTKKLTDYSEVLSISLPINLTRIKMHYLQGDKNLFSSTHGWGLDYSSKDHNDLIESGRKAAIRHSNSRNVYFSENLESLKEIIEFTKKRGIKILFFTPPSYTSYVENLDKSRINQIVGTITRLDDANDNIYYQNFLYDQSFIADDYFDADHLNEIGARKLSQKLDSLLHKIDLKQL
jgi:hypothetical protein